MSDKLTVNELSRTFYNLGETINTDFVEEVSVEELDEHIKEEFSSVINDEELKEDSNSLITDIQSEVTSIEEKKEYIENALVTAKIKDAGFLEKEIKSLILSSKKVLEVLEKDIKVGAPPRMYEVYATLLNAITGQYKELRALNESIAKFVIENKKQNLEEVKEDNKMMFKSTDALDALMAAKQDSIIDSIDADFDILEDDKK